MMMRCNNEIRYRKAKSYSNATVPYGRIKRLENPFLRLWIHAYAIIFDDYHNDIFCMWCRELNIRYISIFMLFRQSLSGIF